MAETLAVNLTTTLTPTGGVAAVSENWSFANEQHNLDFRVIINVPAGAVNQLLTLPGFTTLSLLAVKTNTPINMVQQSSANTPLTVRKFALLTPNADATTQLYFSNSGAAAATVELLAVGD